MKIEVWLYGPLTIYGDGEAKIACHKEVILPAGSCVSDLLDHLSLPTAERGITFINGQLSALPGVQPDLGHPLAYGDRVAFFHLKSMWPFQYRQDAPTIEEFKQKERG